MSQNFPSALFLPVEEQRDAEGETGTGQRDDPRQFPMVARVDELGDGTGIVILRHPRKEGRHGQKDSDLDENKAENLATENPPRETGAQAADIAHGFGCGSLRFRERRGRMSMAGGLASGVHAAIESRSAAPANGKGGTVNLPQEAFIEVLKA